MAKRSDTDRAALERALAMAEDDPELAERIRGRGWRDAATTAVDHFQCVNLRLKPWETPPMYLDADADADDTNAGGVALLRKMLAAGLSRYELDPLAALAEAGKAGA